MSTEQERSIRPNPEVPEQAGADFYRAGQERPEQPFRPDFAKSEKADEVAEKILRPEFGKKPAEVPAGQHVEAGIPLPNEIRTEAEKREAVEKLMALGNGKQISPYDLNRSLEDLKRDQAA